MNARFVFACALVLSCKGADTPQPAAAGEECAIAGRQTHPCAHGASCVEAPFTPVPALSAGEVRGPEQASGVGGACGGVAGFHCTDGLACDMPPDQANAADGMGTCARKSVCR